MGGLFFGGSGEWYYYCYCCTAIIVAVVVVHGGWVGGSYCIHVPNHRGGWVGWVWCMSYACVSVCVGVTPAPCIMVYCDTLALWQRLCLSRLVEVRDTRQWSAEEKQYGASV